MLFLIQIGLALGFIIVLVQVIIDAFRGGFLILEGLILLLAGYLLRLLALPFRLLRLQGRPKPLAVHTWNVVPA